MAIANESIEKIIQIRNLTVEFNRQPILKEANLDIYKNDILGIVGESGGGKTTLLRSMLMLQKTTKGSIHIFNKNILHLNEKQLKSIQRRWGVMFQHNALFSSLTVLENVLFLLRTQTNLDLKFQKEIAFLKIALVGLPLDAAMKFPSELSGGMQKRAALARAIALDPELLFLDEPTSGLDPHSAQMLDQLILDLWKALNLTIIMVTHDLDTLWMVTNRVAFLGQGNVLATLPMTELVEQEQPTIKTYFSGLRARRANKARMHYHHNLNDNEES
jgi:phospholipid/cholesterol/gamma-HCH transport system ATP-binding protein